MGQLLWTWLLLLSASHCFSLLSRVLIPSISRSVESRADAKKPSKVRVDDLLVERGLATDRDQALRYILARSVLVREGEVVQSPASMVSVNDKVRLKGKQSEYVSRSANKLAKAIEAFNLAHLISNSSCIDIGSSTGGFTQVLLLNDARRVYAVDVGVSILDYQLRVHPRVTVLEKVNARYLEKELIADSGDIGVVVCDVSFISLRLVLGPSLTLCRQGAVLIALIKPQFECSRDQLEEGGIIRSEATRMLIVESITEWFADVYRGSWIVEGTIESPITGLGRGHRVLLQLY
jgi:23S rRNA (cytidine1920-2'-O)/16S rRNA (cytidine1409-2'-O)-methyltransferase